MYCTLHKVLYIRYYMYCNICIVIICSIYNIYSIYERLILTERKNMKIDFGETRLEKVDRLSKPHKWFAWYPVEISAHDYRWIEYVERTGRPSALCDGLYFWRYKAIPKTVGDVLKGVEND